MNENEKLSDVIRAWSPTNGDLMRWSVWFVGLLMLAALIPSGLWPLLPLIPVVYGMVKHWREALVLKKELALWLASR